MACRERGMALVTVVMLLTLLLALAHILTEKIWQSSRQTAEAAVRERVFWAAYSGVEWSRQRLAEVYRSSAGWQDCLSVATFGVYPAVPLWTTELNGVAVELFVRDNADGDDDPLRDNDLKIFVLARARAVHGAEVMVESLCGFALATDATHYPQASGSSELTAARGEDSIDLVDQPVTVYQVGD